jgi:hypothetical protein
MENELAREGVKQLAQRASEFLAKIVNPPLEQLGGLLADHVKYWRFKNQIDMVLKAEKLLQDRGVAPATIPLRTLVPLLEEASLEEDATMQERWASLLASAADPAFASRIQTSYVGILKELSPAEANLMDQLFLLYEATEQDKREALLFGKEPICEALRIAPDTFDLMASNLTRLGLIQPPASHGGVAIGKYPIVMRTFELIQLTKLGHDFVRHARYGSA